MKHHLWMHGGLAAAMLAVLGLSALGVAVPVLVVYSIMLACPLMMASMILGGHSHRAGDATDRVPLSDPTQANVDSTP
jgi:hypothetical protein